jgi:hypothetical protein
MAKRIRKRKCKHCRTFFQPDPRNARHQEYCSEPACRKASKAASQSRWLQKEENRNHFRGPEHVLRVQQWRKAHPGYWRRKASKSKDALQDLLSDKTKEKQSLNNTFEQSALQDLLSSQHAVLIGLIAKFTGTALQDDIAITCRHLQQLGDDILNYPTQCKGETYDRKTPHLSPASSPHPQPVQLGGSTLGP